MSRLPTPGGDSGSWGKILNDFLEVEHNTDGTLKKGSDIAEAKSKAGTAVQSVNGKTGTAVTLVASDMGAEPVGLSNETAARFSHAELAVPAPVVTPDGFTWTDHPLAGKLFVDQYGVFSTTFDPATRKYSGGTTYYVDGINGNDANSGTSPGSGNALQSIIAAVNKPDAGTVMVLGYSYGTPYYRGRAFNNATLGKHINIIGYGGSDVYITTHDVLTFTLVAGQTSTYQTTRSNVTECMDMIAGAPGQRLTKVASIAACEALTGSWHQNGSTLYVHAADNRNLSTTNASRIWALLNVPNFKNVGDYMTYLENVKLYGGMDCVRVEGTTSTGAQATLVNVETGMSQALGGGNNVSIYGGDAVLVNCETTRSGQDGNNYHALNGKIPHVVEVGCRSTDNGHSASDQCSTIHDGGKIIRVAGTYRNATASTIADVNAGTESWNLGCVADGAGVGFANWQIGLTTDTSGTPPKMWLHACSSANATYSVAAYGIGQAMSRGSRLERNLRPTTAY